MEISGLARMVSIILNLGAVINIRAVGAFSAANGYKWAGRGALAATVVLGGMAVMDGYEKDGGQIGYNTEFAAASATGGLVGGYAGAEGGALIGAAIGVWFGGVGAIPGAVIGGIAGGMPGSSLGEASVNSYYGR